MVKNIMLAVTIVALSFAYIVHPLLTYNQSTSANVETTLLLSPFVESDRLIYEWRGDLVKSCPVDLRRSITDSEGVVTHLTTRPFGALPADALGEDVLSLLEIRVPSQIATGPAVYQVVEVPKCNWLQRVLPNPFPYPPVKFTVER